MLKRCNWAGEEKIYQDYHDKEWGKPVHDDYVLFEFLILETFQAGLSWITILKKRENFKIAFDNFDFNKVANYNDNKFNELINNSGIVRNKLKIKASVTNAQCFMEIIKEFGSFNKYIWQFVNNSTIVNNFIVETQIPANTPLSDAVSKDLKKRGFKFVGSTVVYAFMQAIGMVNDHVVDCYFRF
ncbi:MAG: DNA-3-methyladenine glycosylase I [Ichthyobacteriaceae bacterium]|nr:DNA-3-methyladenine glycosylase I [Ichthyobacteriaceae bacterium]